MNKTLNIINGDACIGIMKEANIQGEFLAWQDFLHEGSVPPKLTLEELSVIRAKFIARYGLGDFDEIYKNFQERDEKLRTYKNYNKIIFWFEHDLYDQLQLLQLLDWFSDKPLKNIQLTLICSSNYLGESTAEQIKNMLHNDGIDLLPEHFQLARKAWSAFREPTPLAWIDLLQHSSSILKFLKPTVLRMMEEFPNTKAGLSRTEYQALLIISNGINDAQDIFIKCQSFEERKFMGDVVFWKILDNFEEYKIIQRREKKLSITPLGKELLNGERFWFDIMPLERYIGGCKLTLDNLWCWDVPKKTLKKYYFSKVMKTLLVIK